MWKNLEKLIGPENCANFMFMGHSADGTGDLCLYKHVVTRRYLNVDRNGNTYQYNGRQGNYTPIDPSFAIAEVLG
jgi:hypothetical protein